VTLRIGTADRALHQARRWLHLPVEVQARGLHSRLFLASSAAERGYGTVVGRKGDLAALAVELPRGIYLEKSCQLPVDGYEARHAIGHSVCCLDEEGVVYIDAEDYAASRLAVATMELFERFFAWGDDQAAVVAGFHPPSSERIIVTGNPRVDLWRPELRTIYEADAEALRQRYGSFVLLPTAFAMVNNSRGPRHHLEVVAINGMLDTEEGTKRAHGYLEHHGALFEATCKTIVRVAEAVPDRAVVIRPHPAEDLAAWERVAAMADNLTVVREGPVTPWLLAADAIVHSNCTTGLEGFLMGRPTIAFAPRQDVRYDQNLPNRVSQLATDEDELIDLVRANLEHRQHAATASAMELVSRHIAALEGPFAAERLVDAFDEIDVPALPLEPSLARRAQGQLALAALRARRLARSARGRTRSSRPESTANNRAPGKFPGSSVAEARSFIEQLRGATGRFADVACFELGPNVYAIVPSEADPG